MFGRVLKAIGTGRFAALSLLFMLALVRIADPPLLEAMRLRTFDFYQMYEPRPMTPLPVTIVDIDEESLAYLGQWPWPRNVVADLLASISRLGGVAVAFDMVFAEEDRMSPDAYARSLPNLTQDLSRELLARPNTDALLAAQMRNTLVVLGQSGTIRVPTDEAKKATQQTPFATIGGDPKPYLLRFPGLLRNIPVLEEAAAGRGMFSIRNDLDGIVRRVPLVMAVQDTIQPALTLDLLRVATGQSTILTKMDEAGMRSVVVGRQEIPTDRHGRLWVYFTPHDPDRYVSAQALFRGELPREKIANHVILIGTSAVGLLDIKATPLEPSMPGVEVHAQLLETILSGQYLTRPNYAIGAELSAAVLVTLVIIALVPVLGAFPVLVFGFVVAAVLAGGSWYFFVEHRILLDVVYPLAVSFIVFGTLVFINYRREEMQRRQIRSAFSQYLSPDMVAQLARDPKRLKLGGDTRTMTILFSDVRGFTAISESYKSDPQGLTTLMNRFLTPLSNAIMENNGTIDKYMGD
ncbi:MAG: CHASE2 domain-containing protein, partial [Rhodobiaceae bacterium]|nr:CHASE2 domain-containing protein [Rhodobiaceae bacterium]